MSPPVLPKWRLLPLFLLSGSEIWVVDSYMYSTPKQSSMNVFSIPFNTFAISSLCSLIALWAFSSSSLRSLPSNRVFILLSNVWFKAETEFCHFSILLWTLLHMVKNRSVLLLSITYTMHLPTLVLVPSVKRILNLCAIPLARNILLHIYCTLCPFRIN